MKTITITLSAEQMKRLAELLADSASQIEDDGNEAFPPERAALAQRARPRNAFELEVQKAGLPTVRELQRSCGVPEI
jgi:hypothetical protein